MNKYIEILLNGYIGYVDFFWFELTHPSFKNYAYLLDTVCVPQRRNEIRLGFPSGEDFQIPFMIKHSLL